VFSNEGTAGSKIYPHRSLRKSHFQSLVSSPTGASRTVIFQPHFKKTAVTFRATHRPILTSKLSDFTGPEIWIHDTVLTNYICTWTWAPHTAVQTNLWLTNYSASDLGSHHSCTMSNEPMERSVLLEMYSTTSISKEPVEHVLPCLRCG
jgi:hypothetical protein